MTYVEAIQFLYDLRLFGAKFGTENTVELAGLAGQPHHRLRFIHVAGTNGKGSTCAMLESVYRASGLRVGLFTSPHLVSFGERIQVDRRPIPQADVVRLVQLVRGWMSHFPSDAHPTFFEAVTVMALKYFAEQECDLVIWETGLGGRLDATNIVTPLASVITNIQYDHQVWLGHTLEEIAVEKAGIIKPGVPVITAATPDAGLEVIRNIAAQQRSALHVVTAQDADRLPLHGLGLPLRGDYQRQNAAVAVATVNCLREAMPVSPAQLVAGLTQVDWPGRFQLVSRPGDRLLLLDGAHNAPGSQALAHELEKQFPGRNPTVIFGVFSDKDWHSMAALLAEHAGRVLLVPVKSQRTVAPEQLAPVCRESHPGITVEVCASLEDALERTDSDPFVVITGSLYLVGEALELLHLAPVPPSDERLLNEWSGVRH